MSIMRGFWQTVEPVCSATLLVLLLSTISWVQAADDAEDPDQAVESDEPAITAPEPPTHMTEALRATVSKIVVLPDTSPAEQGLTGSYNTQTKGFLGGWDAGRRIGRPSAEIGPVSVSFPIPILTWPGAILGSLHGMTKRQMQDFRDRLTEDLVKAADKPLSNEKLASDVFWQIRGVPTLKPKVLSLEVPIPTDTEAILFVALTDVTIDVDKSDAVITTSAEATLRRTSDGHELYRQRFYYQDRDNLRRWNADDNRLWRDYANFARHYIGREIAAEVFERVKLNHTIAPAKSASIKALKKNVWDGETRSLMPTLSWDFELLGDDQYGAWAETLSPTDVTYDVEVYDRHQLVYAERDIASSEHTLALPLEACTDYYWSVRPSYNVGSERKFGDWMRGQPGEGDTAANIGRRVSIAPAYLQDFARLKVHCKSS